MVTAERVCFQYPAEYVWVFQSLEWFLSDSNLISSSLSHGNNPSSVGTLPKCPPDEVSRYIGLFRPKSLIIAAGRQSKCFIIKLDIVESGSPLDPRCVSRRC